MNDKYFEGILQLRNPSSEIMDFVNTRLKKEGVFVAKTVSHKRGIDLFVSSNRFILRLGKKLSVNYGGILKTSRKLHTRDSQTSKDLFRVTVFVEFPKIINGDIIKVKSELVKVSSIGRTIKGTSLKTGKRISVPKDDYKVLEKHKTSVSKVHPAVEVLHPESYESVKTQNHKDIQVGEKVIVVIDSGIWIV